MPFYGNLMSHNQGSATGRAIRGSRTRVFRPGEKFNFEPGPLPSPGHNPARFFAAKICILPVFNEIHIFQHRQNNRLI